MIMQYANYLIVVLLLLMMPACRRGKLALQGAETIWSGVSQQDCTNKHIDTAAAAHIIEKEARLDVPLPLQITPHVDYFLQSSPRADQETIMVGYQTVMTPEQLIKFYNDQMECFGWKQIFSCVSTESVLIFQKPHGNVERVCSIAIRPSSRTHSSLVICAGMLASEGKTGTD